MTISLEQVLARFSPEELARIETRTAELIAGEMTLRDLRKAHALTQQAMAEQLGIKQESVSNLEARSDMLISTLRGYVAAVGGKLELIVSFPGRPPVSLQSLAIGGGERHRKPVKRKQAQNAKAGS